MSRAPAVLPPARVQRVDRLVERILRADGAAPLEWPASAPPWSRYRASWLELVQHVGRVLDGDVLDPCPGADHWGMRSGVDWERARRAGWELLECDAETRNAFWRVPRRPQGDVL